MGGFVTETWKQLFAQHQVGDFEQLWQLRGESANAPNTRDSGTSTVERFQLANGNVFYIKKQHNYFLSGIPLMPKKLVAEQEFINISRINACGIDTMEPVYFQRRGNKAIFVTAALQGYDTLDIWLKQSVNLRRKGLRLLGEKIAGLHRANLIHRCLYPWHIYIKSHNATIDIRLIDLEKTRFAWWRKRAYLDDVLRLLRYVDTPRRGDVLAFLQGYQKQKSSRRRLLQRSW